MYAAKTVLAWLVGSESKFNSFLFDIHELYSTVLILSAIIYFDF